MGLSLYTLGVSRISSHVSDSTNPHAVISPHMPSTLGSRGEITRLRDLRTLLQAWIFDSPAVLPVSSDPSQLRNGFQHANLRLGGNDKTVRSSLWRCAAPAHCKCRIMAAHGLPTPRSADTVSGISSRGRSSLCALPRAPCLRASVPLVWFLSSAGCLPPTCLEHPPLLSSTAAGQRVIGGTWLRCGKTM